MAELNAGNLYEMNKTLVAKYEKSLKGTALWNQAEKVVTPYFTDHLTNSAYFMLLCHELRDYTVFNVCGGHAIFEECVNTMQQEFIECLKNRGDIYGIDKAEDNEALEIWIKSNDDNEMYCYYMFPYDAGVIEV